MPNFASSHFSLREAFLNRALVFTLFLNISKIFSNWLWTLLLLLGAFEFKSFAKFCKHFMIKSRHISDLISLDFI